MNHRFFTFVFIFLVMHGILLLSPAHALTTIEGFVSDGQGNPLANVIVAVYGDARPGPRRSITAGNGHYRISQLLPGDYSLLAEKEGYQTLTISTITVDELVRVLCDFVMEPHGEEEVVSPAQTRQAVESRQVLPGMSVPRTFFERLPDHDRLEAAFLMPAGVTGVNYPFIHGGSHADNSFFIDGIQVDDIVFGQFTTTLNEDAIHSVEVLSGGLPAEYGGMMGGQVRIVTRRGDNDISGIVRFRYLTDYFNAPSEPGKPEIEVRDHFEPSFSMGGPFVKDRLWYFFSYRNHFYENSKDIFSNNWYACEYSFTTVQAKEDYQSYNGRLSFQVSEDTLLEYMVVGDPVARDFQGSQFYTYEAQYRTRQGSMIHGLSLTSVISPRFELETSVGYHRSYYYIDPQHDSGKPAVYDRKAHLWFDNYYMKDHTDWTRFSVSSAATYIEENWYGKHELKLGLGYEDHSEERTYDFTTGRYYEIDYYGTEYKQPQRRYNYIMTEPEKETAEFWSVFIQDRWVLSPRLEVNAGVRWERSEFRNRIDDVVTTFDPTPAPRLNVHYWPGTARRSTVHLSVGRYYNPYDLSIIEAHPGPSRYVETWYYDPDHP